MKKYFYTLCVVIALIGGYSIRHKLVAYPDTATSTSTSTSATESLPQVCLRIGEKQFCMPWEAAQLSAMLKDMLDAMPEPDEDDEGQESIIFPVSQNLFGPATIEKLVASMKILHKIKSKNLELNRAQILDELHKDGLVTAGNALQLAKAADYYRLSLLWQAIARWYAKEKVEIASLGKRGVELMGEPVFSEFATEYYRQYWLIHKKLPAAQSNEMFMAEYKTFGVSFQELLDNGWALTGYLIGKHINSLDGFRNIPYLPARETIHLNANKLTKIAAGAFKDLPALETIHLNTNKLTKIAAGAFKNP